MPEHGIADEPEDVTRVWRSGPGRLRFLFRGLQIYGCLVLCRQHWHPAVPCSVLPALRLRWLASSALIASFSHQTPQ